MSEGKCFDVRYGDGGDRDDVVFTVFAKDETDAWDIAYKIRDETYDRDEHDFYGIDCLKSEWATEESDCENYKESEDEQEN